MSLGIDRFRRSRAAVLLPLAAAGLLALAGGCSSSPTAGLDTATTSIEETGRQIDVGISRMDEVMRVLAEMDVDADADVDLAATFKSYRSGIAALEKAAASVRSRRAAMRARTQDHIEAWRAQLAELGSETAREVSAARQAEFEATANNLEASLDELADAYSALVTDLKDIEIVLANDLSRSGVQAARPLIREAIENAAEVRIRAGETNRVLTSARDEFSR